MKRILMLAGSTLALSLSATPLSARQPSGPLEEVTVTSSRIATPLRQIGTSVAVMTEEQIEAHGNFSLLDIVRQMPATASSSNGGIGKVSALRIRGEEGFRTLTIFDGIRLLDPSTPQIGPQFEQILSSGVGRVEVLRGPQGLSFGADAGGVINLFSRRDVEGFNADFDLESGEFGTRQVAGTVSGRDGAVDYYFSATDLSTDGFNSRLSDVDLRDHDGYRNTTLHGRVGFQLSENWRMDLVHRDVAGETEFDGCFAQVVVNDCEADYELSASRVSLDYSSDGVTHTLAYASTATDRQNYALKQPAVGASGELQRLEYLGSVSGLPGFGLVFGADLEEADSGTSSRENQGIFVEYLSDFSDVLFITAGIRHDDNDDFGSNLSYRLSGAYLIDLGVDSLLKFRGSYGTGFRAPSPFEIEYNRGPFAFPPASLVSLEQETSKGFELGVEYLAGDELKLEAVYFDQEIDDAIYFDLAGFSGYLQDLGTSNSEGIELSARYLVTDSFEVSGNYTHNRTKRPNGQQRIRRPEKLANLALAYRAFDDRLVLNAFYRISRDAIDEVFGVTTPLDDFEVLDLTTSYDFSDAIRLYGRIENVTDETYQEVTGFRSAQRALYLGVRLTF
jgi:vitamin B12 transporter